MDERECQLVNHVALVQLDSVDTEPMDACNALTAPSEGLRREHVNAVAVVGYSIGSSPITSSGRFIACSCTSGANPACG
jgi:hypothetical protein